MLELLFRRSLTRYTASPHAADLDAFASMLVGQGYKDRVPERHTRRLLQALQAADPREETQIIDL